ncbi:MAG TPA: hypothetical protein VHW00_04845 [Thermoanaerobaculia bacterium]|nr:hypothetical protein [Thermoanaerobaculia bacterium]
MSHGLRRIVPALLVLGGCVSTTPRIPDAWMSVPATPRVGSVFYDASGKLQTAPELAPPMLADGPIRFVGTKIFNKEKELTAAFPAVESLDFSESRGEVVFSAVGERGFDIGLVSSDGSKVNWVPQDPADEFSPQWAPRGNKVSFIVRAKIGDIVRTVHIPTAAQLSNDFPHARIHSRAWDAEGQFYAVAYSTPDASDRVEVMKYGGEERAMAVPPAVRLDVEVEPFASGTLVLRPKDIRYDERLPAVIWLAPDFAWNDARGALLRNGRVACIVAKTVSDELLTRIRETPWLDATELFVVGEADVANAIVIKPDAAMKSGFYRESGRVVSVAPAAIQSFASGFIADQLKRISPTNGSSR